MTTSAENTHDASLEEKVNERYFQLSDILRYTHKMPFPYHSRLQWVRMATSIWSFRLVRVYPIAYRPRFSFFVGGGIMSGSTGTHPFLWMTESGDLVQVSSEGWRCITLHRFIEEVADDDYELLVLWLSNESQAALRRIEELTNEAQEKAWTGA